MKIYLRVLVICRCKLCLKQEFSGIHLFMNEPTFLTNGQVLSWNSHHWAFGNPYYVIKRISQLQHKGNLLCGFDLVGSLIHISYTAYVFAYFENIGFTISRHFRAGTMSLPVLSRVRLSCSMYSPDYTIFISSVCWKVEG